MALWLAQIHPQRVCVHRHVHVWGVCVLWDESVTKRISLCASRQWNLDCAAVCWWQNTYPSAAMVWRLLWQRNVTRFKPANFFFFVILYCDTLSQTKNFDINPKRPLIIFDFGYWKEGEEKAWVQTQRGFVLHTCLKLRQGLDKDKHQF